MSSGQKAWADEQKEAAESRQADGIRKRLSDTSDMRDWDLIRRHDEIRSLLARLEAGGTFTIDAAQAFVKLQELAL